MGKTKQSAAAGSKGTSRSRRNSKQNKKQKATKSSSTRKSMRLENKSINAKAKQPVEMIRTVESLEGDCAAYAVKEKYKLLYLASLGLYKKTGGGKNAQDFRLKNKLLKKMLENFNYLNIIANEPSPVYEPIEDFKDNNLINYITVDSEEEYWQPWTPNLTYAKPIQKPATGKEIAEGVKKVESIVKQWSRWNEEEMEIPLNQNMYKSSEGRLSS